MITKDIAIAALVRAFFKYYVTGVLEAHDDIDPQERFEPKSIKRIMLNHYERISKAFNIEAFYAISRMNYKSEEIESLLKDFFTTKTTDMDLVRFACRTDDMYDVMVEEYRRNFTNLLSGRIETEDEHGEIDIEAAELIINRMAAKAYELGKADASTKVDN